MNTKTPQCRPVYGSIVTRSPVGGRLSAAGEILIVKPLTQQQSDTKDRALQLQERAR